MKRRITLSLALALSVVLLSLTSSDSTAQAQNQMRVVADTGVITLDDSNQVLRITVDWGDGNPSAVIVRFRRTNYQPITMEAGFTSLAVASQTTSNPITLTTGEAASFDIPASFLGGVFVGVRGVVESNRRDVRVNAVIMDTITDRIVAWVPTGTVTF